jgi:ferrochelatase
MTHTRLDSVLFVGFGGPTPGCCGRFEPCPGREALCFVKAIVGDRPGAQARIAEVAAHYEHFGGFSPFNALTFQQAQGVAGHLHAQGFHVPVRVGMRYWPPYVHEVLHDMATEGLRHILAVILSPLQCAASWEHYQQTVTTGVKALGAQGPEVTYLAPWHMEAGYIAAVTDTIQDAEQTLGAERAPHAALIYTAHAIPVAMAAHAPYMQQFAATAAAAAQRLGRQDYRLAYQSQVTGTPVPWLQPDINDTIQQVHAEGYRDVIVAPIGFLCDHMEVLYDLDIQARDTAIACGMTYVRAATVGNHPAFVAMLSTLIAQRLQEGE